MSNVKRSKAIIGLFLLLFIQFVTAQTGEKLLVGKIVADSAAVEKVTILNDNTNKTAVSDKDGIFKIPVNVGDALVISALNLEIRRRKITEDDLKQDVLLIRMSTKMTHLEQVDVNQYSDINSENMGITKHGQKRYSPAERKLRTATTGLLDPLLNKMSGRTSQLKKEIQVERNERLLLKLDGWYDDKYYTDVLKIPEDHIQGFQYYIVEDPDFARALTDKNKTLTMFYIRRLAINYLEIVQKENAKTD